MSARKVFHYMTDQVFHWILYQNICFHINVITIMNILFKKKKIDSNFKESVRKLNV